MRSYVFPFGPGAGTGEGDESLAALLGATGAAMAGLCRDRLPVPPGFTLSAEVCACYARHGAQYPAGVWDQIRAQVRRLEGLAMSEADSGRRPLLLTVRVDGAAAMPEAARRPVTLGFSDRATPAFARATGGECAAVRRYARLVRDYGILVEGIQPAVFDGLCDDWRPRHGTAPDVDAWRELSDGFKRAFFERVHRPFPQELLEQLRGVLGAAYDAWMTGRHGLPSPSGVRAPGAVGAAVTASTAVFGDLGGGSAAGTACSRNPEDGTAAPSGWFQTGADADPCGGIAAGRLPLASLAAARDTELRAAHAALRQHLARIEKRAGQPMEVEFVVEKGRLWVVHACVPRRTPAAALRWAAEMAGGRDLETGRALPRIFSPDAALLTVLPSELDPAPVGLPRGRRDPGRRAFDQILAWAGLHTPLEIQAEAGAIDDVRAARDLGAAGVGLLHPAGLLSSGPVVAALRVYTRNESEGALLDLRVALGDGFEQIFSILSGRPAVLEVPGAGDEAVAAALAAASPRAGRADGLATAVCGALLRAFLETAVRLGRRRIRPRPALAVAADCAAALERNLAAVRAALDAVQRLPRARLHCPIGGILRVPRALLTADAVAEHVEFLVLKIADLDGWLQGRPPRPAGTAPEAAGEPSRRFDTEGLGSLMEAGIKRGRTARPDLQCAVVTGEIPDAPLFRLCLRAGIGRVVCPPARLAAARLAAAHVAIRSRTRGG